ncbi:MAG: low molecular weight phosphotyrosine protein phosphatase [Flavobacteriaceae bacterium]|nr:low molecular weight phosphotyrosine protein phosphatase [Flavobacteriaceae bacterium]
MVCLGNICRSPLAEGILKAKVDADFIYVDSAGTSAFHRGELPDSRSIEIAEKYNIDITEQRSRQFIAADFEIFDAIYVMDDSNKNNVLALAKNSDDRNKVKLILNETTPNQDLNVPDPYYDNGFENVYQMLNEACTHIANNI